MGIRIISISLTAIFCTSCAPQRATFVLPAKAKPAQIRSVPASPSEASTETLFLAENLRPLAITLRHTANDGDQTKALKEYLNARAPFVARTLQRGDYRENRLRRQSPERQTIVAIEDGYATANTTVSGVVTATSTIRFSPVDPAVESIDDIVKFLADENTTALWAELTPYIESYFKLPKDVSFSKSKITINILKARWLKLPSKPFQLTVQILTEDSPISDKGPCVIEIRLQPEAPSPLHIVHLAAGGLIPNFVLYHFDEVGYVSP